MAGSVARRPIRIGTLLLLLVAVISTLLILQFTCSDSDDEAAISQTGGPAEIRETGGAGPAPTPQAGSTQAGAAAPAQESTSNSTFIVSYTAGGSSTDDTGQGSTEPAPPAPGSISGQVEGDGGERLAGIYVYLADGDGNLTGAFRVTDAQGSFNFTGRQPAPYKLFFSDPASEYDPGWYGAQGSPAGVVIELGPGGAINIKHTMVLSTDPATGSITGRVMAPCKSIVPGCEEGVGDVLVMAMYVKNDNGLQLTLTGMAVTDSSGYYRIDNLTTGDYMVSFNPASDKYAFQWYRGQNSFETAEILPLSAGETIGKVDASLKRGGTISGTVTGEGDPLDLVLVDIYDDSGVIVDSTTTDQTGAFTSSRLPEGHYRIKARALSGDYRSEWYNDKQDFSAADKVAVIESQNTTGVHMDLESVPVKVTAAGPSKEGMTNLPDTAEAVAGNRKMETQDGEASGCEAQAACGDSDDEPIDDRANDHDIEPVPIPPHAEQTEPPEVPAQPESITGAGSTVKLPPAA